MAALLLTCACRAEPAGRGPEEVTREFIERMQSVHGDPQPARAAFDLLWAEGRSNLQERARRASALAGRPVSPEEMIAPSHFTVRFKPKQFAARTDGDWAVVTLSGEAPAAQRAEIRCRREEGRWRVVLELPPLAPIQKRPDGGV